MEARAIPDLAEKIRVLTIEKEESENRLKQIKADIEEAKTQLSEVLSEAKISGIVYKGKIYSRVKTECVTPAPEKKEKLYAAMKEHGFYNLFIIHATTLQKAVLKLKEDNCGFLPEWLLGLVSIQEKESLNIKKQKIE